MVETPLDRFGIHMIVSDCARPVACFSVIPPEYTIDYARTLGIPQCYIGRIAFSTKFAILPDHRKRTLAPLMVACWEHYFFAPRQYRYAFSVLKGKHCAHQRFYEKLVGFSTLSESVCEYGKEIVMIMDRESEATRTIRTNVLDVCLAGFLRGK